MRTKSMVVRERTGKSSGEQYLIIKHENVEQAFKKFNDEWIRVELKSALLDIGVSGTRADHTHALARQL